MYKRLLFALICVVSMSNEISAQSACPGSLTCDGAGVLCTIGQLNGFTCNNPTMPNPTFPTPDLCHGVGVPHNLNWWAFVGCGGALSLTFNFNPASCESGQGIQAGVFEGSCDGASIWDCNASCNTSTFTLSGSTSPCEIYYVWVDGCNGDVCTYTMSAVGATCAPSLRPKPIPPLRTTDRICPCGTFEVQAPTFTGCEPQFRWKVNGVPAGDEPYLQVMVPENANPGDRITVCLKAVIGNPENPNAICDADSVCTNFIVQPIPMEVGRCEVVCFEDQPYFWQGFPITSSCISPPCSIRVQGPDECCIDSLKPIILLPPPGIGAKDTFICQNGIPLITEDGKVWPGEVCDELIEFQRRVIHPACPTDVEMCDTSYYLSIGRFKYIKDPEFDCAACSGKVTINPNVEYDPDCPQYIGQVSITLEWFNGLTNEDLGQTPGDGFIEVTEAGRYCFYVSGNYRGIDCFDPVPQCITVPADLFPEQPPISGDSIICAQRYGVYTTSEPDDICDYVWTIQSGGGRIVTPNSLDSSQVRVDWSGRTGSRGVVCVSVVTDCGTLDSCYTVTFLPAPQPDAGPDQIICGLNTDFDGTADYPGGYWTQILGPTSANIVDVNDINSQVAADTYGEYKFIWTEENLDCDGVDTVTILFAPDPYPENIDTICSGDATEFKVRFTIRRGQAPYTIVQGAGMIVNDSNFVSETIMDNTPTTIVIMDDNGCEFTYFIDHDCVCNNAAGEMAMDTLKFCGPDGEACGIYDPTNMVLEAGLDTFAYYLYTTLGDIQGTYLATNATGCFSFDPATMQLDRIYYIGVLVGRKGSSGELDFDGGCLQPAEAQPVIWLSIPEPDAGLDTAICGQVINLNGTLQINGRTFRWLNTPGATINDNVDLTTTVSVAPNYGTYNFVLEEVNDICPGYDTVSITFNESPTGSPQEICINYETFTFEVRFTIEDGTAPYTIVQGGGTIDPVTNEYVSPELNSGPYVIIIEDANGCQFIIDDDHECDCGDTDPGTMGPAEQACVDQCITVCSDMSEVLQADEEAFFVLHRGSGNVLQGELMRIPYDHTANPCENVQFCFDPAVMTPGVTYYISRLVRERNNADDPCERISPGKPVVWYSYPAADPGPDMDTCGLEATLRARPSVGIGTWSLVGSPAGSNAIFGAAVAQSLVTVDMYGTYTFQWREDNESCADSAEVSITFHDAPIAQVVEFICDDVAENYKIVIQVNNGDQSSWRFTNNTQVTDLGQGRYETGWIPTGARRSFCVTDVWNCAPSCIDTTFECICITEPGIVTSDDALCIDECVQANYQGGVLDPNDVVRYVLHDGDANNLGTIIECNDDGEFCFNANLMTPNVPYYIAVMAGNQGGNGCVDMNERCAVISDGVPVTWYEYPTPDITQSEPQFTCMIDSMILDGSASTGPGAISYSWRALTGTICSSSDPNDQMIYICSEGSYILTVIHDIAGCSTSDTIEIGSDESRPSVDAGNPLELTCDQPVVTLDGTGTQIGSGFSVRWLDPLGVEIATDQLQVQVSTPGRYRIEVVNTVTDCDNFAEVDVTENIQPPQAIIDPAGDLTCQIKEIDLSGSASVTQGGVRSYSWSTNDGTIEGSNTGASVRISDPGTYQLIIVDDRNGCRDTTDVIVDEIGNTLAQFDVEPTPPRCYGENNGELIINGIAGGTEPFEYSFDGGPFGSSTQFNNLAPGTYDLTVRDANGCEKDTVITIPETPDINITAKQDMVKEAGSSVDLDTLILSTFGVLPVDADSIIWYDDVTNEELGRYPSKIPVDSMLEQRTFRVVLWENGCFKSDYITIFIRYTKRVFIPNVINPGSSIEKNGKLYIFGNKNRILNIKFLRVYDRWGELVYAEDDIPYNEPQGRSEDGWDGTFNGELMNPGVFVYHTQIEFLGGAVEDYYGDVTLLLKTP